MRPFATLERFLERLFERPGARLFRARLEPVTLARRLERTIDEQRRIGADGMLAPTRFTVQVSPPDATALRRVATLEADLAGVALDHARRRGYRIVERPTVAVVGSAALRAGDVAVAAGFPDAAGALPEAPPEHERTQVHPLPVAAPAGTILRVVAPGAAPREVALDGRPLAIGRAPDADVVIDDPLVSRRHATLAARGGRLVLVDLQSRNGTRVNGRAIREVVVGPGDRIEIGATRLEVAGPTSARAEAQWTPG